MRNIAASVRQRLLNLSKAQNRPFQEVLQYYVMERFLYRLARSKYSNQFILKGALMLQVWNASQARPTMDIDMLGLTSNETEPLLEQFRHVFESDSGYEDGLVFHADSLHAESITQDADYKGLRIRGIAEIERAQAKLQVDIGFGDAVVPQPQEMKYPVLLDMPAPELLCYSCESAIAEKFQAMVALGSINSRMKDFYDIWLFSRQFQFASKDLASAIHATFENRATPIPAASIFTADFATEKQAQWSAFLRRLGVQMVAESVFANVLEELQNFLGGALDESNDVTAMVWPPGGPWQNRQIIR